MFKSKVPEGKERVTTVAAIGASRPIRAVNKLLLREGQEFSRCSKVGPFESSDGGEGPAWAAVLLVFDWRNTTKLNPIDRIG